MHVPLGAQDDSKPTHSTLSQEFNVQPSTRVQRHGNAAMQHATRSMQCNEMQRTAQPCERQLNTANNLPQQMNRQQGCSAAQL